MLDTRLADRIRAKGVPVVEIAGWQTRGRPAVYRPKGAVNHHTAGARSGSTPSLATVLFGRPDVPGPLAQVLQSREANPANDRAYVIAAGTCNHAGAGGWNGLTGNASVGGLEVEHHGTGPVPAARLETAARICAALLEAPGSTRNPAFCCQHFEWAPRRKIDFFSLAPGNAGSFRRRVGHWIGRTVTSPAPAPTPVPMEDDDMPVIVRNPSGSFFLLDGGILAAFKTQADLADAREQGLRQLSPSAKTWQVWSSAYRVHHS